MMNARSLPLRRTTTTLAGLAAVALLTAQIVSAQAPNQATVAFETVEHGVRPGAGPSPAASARVGATVDAEAPDQSANLVSAGLTIVPTFDVSITSDPNAAAIEATIYAAIANVESQFSDPIIVNITFQKAGGLGSSSTYYATVSYSTFLAALKGDAKTSDDATAVGLLPNVATNPVNGATAINVKTANFRAVGINVNPPPGQPDGFIGLNTNITIPGSPGSTQTYNLLPVVEHEIDEVLGLGSSLPSVLAGTIFPEDLYRYSAVNTRSFTTANSLALFSINGTTSLAQFHNQNDGADFGDWQSNPLPPGVQPKVQDAFATPGANPALSVELIALDVIGYDRVPSVVPPSITLQPANQTVRRAHNAQFTVAASGTPAPTYQWQVSANDGSVWSNLPNALPYSGVTTTTLTIAGVSAVLNSNQYRAVATNAAGTATSKAATLIVGTRPGDFDGDGVADIAVFRPSTGQWWISYSGGAGTNPLRWGGGGDIPVPADYDGDGVADIAIFRPSTGEWWISYSGGAGTNPLRWGGSGDIPVLKRP